MASPLTSKKKKKRAGNIEIGKGREEKFNYGAIGGKELGGDNLRDFWEKIERPGKKSGKKRTWE